MPEGKSDGVPEVDKKPGALSDRCLRQCRGFPAGFRRRAGSPIEIQAFEAGGLKRSSVKDYRTLFNVEDPDLPLLGDEPGLPLPGVEGREGRFENFRSPGAPGFG